ncbi:MAG: ParB N-terminal domain-containing protein [bacterium]|nr:ParB N-terminal domain-containing protein [bacterium]
MPKIPITEIKVSFRARTDIGNISELAEDIKQHGLLHPLVVTPEKELVAGYRRLKAAESLGWKEVPVTSVEPKQSLDQFDIQLSENMNRKELNPLELSDAILERKHRFEQVYGKIERGGDHCSAQYQESKVTNREFAFPDFYVETGKLLHQNPKTIFRFLQLQGLDTDLKGRVCNREINYQSALREQAERNRAKKPLGKRKSGLPSTRLPNQADIAPMQAQYQSAPNLMQLFILINHSFQTVQKMQEKPLELDKFQMEYLFVFIQQLETVIAYYRELLVQLNQTQEKTLTELAMQ